MFGGEVDREALEHMLGLDVPVPVQYGRWIGGILRHGSLGHSLIGSRGQAAGHHRTRCAGTPHRAADHAAGGHREWQDE